MVKEGSSRYKFAYEEESLINRYVEKIGLNNCLVYVAQPMTKLIDERSWGDPDDPSDDDPIPIPEDYRHFRYSYENSENRPNVKLYNIKNDYNNYSLTTSIDLEDLTQDTLENKHLVILFNINNGSIDQLRGDSGICHSNDYVYAQFEYVLDSISHQYKKEMGILPTYNLIAHSRGGLTNLQYAMGHPFRVASIYSMGTPYNGSDFGSAKLEDDPEDEDSNDEYPFLELADMDDPKYCGVKDIIKPELYAKYKEIWNGNRNCGNHLYDHIKFVPIGSYVTLGFVLQLVMDYLIVKAELGIISEIILRTAAALIEVAITTLANTTQLSKQLTKAVSKFKNVLNREIEEERKRNAWISIFHNISFASQIGIYKHIGFSLPSILYIEDDLFIDLDSQVANGYTGAEPVVKLMDTIDQMEGGKSVNAPGVAHNLETHDKAIINYIISNIDTSGRALTVDQQPNIAQQIKNGVVYTYTIVGDEVVITGISGASETLEIPYDLVDGKNITRIESGVFESPTQTYSMRNSTVNVVKEITLPSTVERIESYAFADMASLERVTINSSAGVSVGTEAFAGCTSLSTVNLGNVTEIGYGAFAGCTSLTSITIPATVTKIDDFAFYNSGISNLNFEAGSQLTEIGYGAFANCSLSEDVTIPATVTKIDDFAFYNSGTSSVSFEAGSQLTEIGHYAFANCSSLSGMVIPSTVTTIGRGAFMNATALISVSYESQTPAVASIGDLAFYGCTSLYLGEMPNVQSIGSFAFAGCNWINENASNITLTIPAGVQNIGAGAFYGCSQIAGFSLASGNSYFHVVDGVLYVKQTNADETVEYYLHTYPIAKTGTEYTAIASLIGVLDYAFAGNVNLTTINLANVQDIGENAFEDCTNLTTISVDSTNEYYSTSDGVLFNKDATCLIYYPLGKTNSSYTIPTTVTEITAGAFAGNTYLTTITVDSANEYYSTSDGVLFNKDATCLIYYPLGKTNSTYTVPTTVTEIALGAFAGNTNLTGVNLKNVQIIGDNAFEGCTNLATITGNSVIEAHSSAFEGAPWYTTQSQAEYFRLGKVLFKYNGSYDASGVLDLRTYATIEENAFPSLNEEGEYIPNTQLTTVYLGEDYSQFNHVSFNSCTALNKVYLLNSEVVQINALTDTLKEQLTFYVPYSLYSSYTATYEDLSFEAIQTTINFYVGEELLDTQTAYYGEVFTTDKVPTVTGNNIFLGWYDTTAYTSTFVGSTYEEFEAEDDLYAKILPTYTLRFVTGIATTCSDITGVYEGKTVRLPNVTQLNYSGSWMNNGANYAFNASMVFLPGVFIVEENNVITFTAAWTTCTHDSKKYTSTSSSAHNVICNTCGYITSSSHMWSVQSNGTYKCRFCKYVTAIIPINPLKVEDEEIIQSLGEAEEGEIITASNGLSYIYLNGEFYLVTQQEELLFLPKKEESE